MVNIYKRKIHYFHKWPKSELGMKKNKYSISSKSQVNIEKADYVYLNIQIHTDRKLRTYKLYWEGEKEKETVKEGKIEVGKWGEEKRKLHLNFTMRQLSEENLQTLQWIHVQEIVLHFSESDKPKALWLALKNICT